MVALIAGRLSAQQEIPVEFDHYEEVRIRLASGWMLYIDPEGGGIFAYGNLPYHMALFPSKTIDLKRIPRSLKIAVRGTEPSETLALLHIERVGATTSVLLPIEIAQELFVAAFIDAEPAHRREWEELLRETKPMFSRKK